MSSPENTGNTTSDARANPLSADHRHIIAELLLVIRREVATTLRPEMTSGYATYVANVVEQILDYMADWIGGPGYPEADTARASLLASLDCAPQTENRFITEFDDATSADRHLGDLVRLFSKSRDDGRLSGIAAQVASIDEKLYLAELARHSERRKADRAYLERIDPELTKSRFETYARDVLGLNDAVAHIDKIPGGHSKDTFLISLASGREMVVRRDFPFGPVNSSAADEFSLLNYLANAGLPVAKPIASEHDPKWLGLPFLLMERVGGGDAQLAAEADRAVGRGVSFTLAKLLARLHSLDPTDAGFATSATPSEEVRKYLSSWRDWWERHRVHQSALLEAGFAWLERNIPQSIPRVVIVHGDARPGNMLARDGQVTALLDWEFAHAGDPSEDLQYAKGYVEPFVGWNDFLDVYQRAGGAPVNDEGAKYYDIFRSLRNVVCCDVSWGGFVRGHYPALKLAAQGVIYKRMLAQQLARSMVSIDWH